MPRRIIDLSTPIKSDHFRWAVERKHAKSFEAGDGIQITWMGWPVHGFTHMDSGRHFSKDAYTTDDISLEQTVGEAAVVDISAVGADAPVTEAAIAEAGGHVRDGDIVLLRAGWDRVESIDTPEFWTRAPYMTADACRWLYARNIKAIAYDFPQDHCIRDMVTGARQPAFEENTTHIELLLKGVIMFEYLCNMTALTKNRVEFIGLPLKVPHADGAPARAIAIEDA
ncbi:MAG: cyclase family protein [Pseudomonadota bacterium]